MSHSSVPAGQPVDLIQTRLTRGDRGIIVLALALLISLYWVYWSSGLSSPQASIYVGGKFWSRVDLYQAQEIEVNGPLGISHLAIEDGKVRFLSSPCSTKLCIHQGWINVGGESVTCLPNEITIEVISMDPRYDSINF